MKLLKLSLSISILGIFLLLLLSNTLNPKLTSIDKINNDLLNKKIKIQGTIFNIRDYDNFQILSVQDETGKIDITLDSSLNLQNNQKIQVIGTVEEYKEYLQIQADEISLIQP